MKHVLVEQHAGHIGRLWPKYVACLDMIETHSSTAKYIITNLNAGQRDGRLAEYRWRPLFNAAKFGSRLLLECRAVTLSRRKTR